MPPMNDYSQRYVTIWSCVVSFMFGLISVVVTVGN
jgi:hypothetical protein